ALGRRLVVRLLRGERVGGHLAGGVAVSGEQPRQGQRTTGGGEEVASGGMDHGVAQMVPRGRPMPRRPGKVIFAVTSMSGEGWSRNETAKCCRKPVQPRMAVSFFFSPRRGGLVGRMPISGVQTNHSVS